MRLLEFLLSYEISIDEDVCRSCLAASRLGGGTRARRRPVRELAPGVQGLRNVINEPTINNLPL